jgi:hypothetical protein
MRHAAVIKSLFKLDDRTLASDDESEPRTFALRKKLL